MHLAMGAGVAAAALVLPGCLNRHVAPRTQRCALPRARKRAVWRAPAPQCQAWVGSLASLGRVMRRFVWMLV